MDASERWKEGQYDLLPVDDESVRDAPQTVAEIVPELWLNYLGFRADVAPFSNIHVRKAFAHAVDREALLAATNSINRPAVRGGAIPPAMPGHSHRVALEFNLERARELLAEAGYPEGRGLPPIEVLVPSWFQFGDALAEQWAAIGAKVTVTAQTGVPDPCAVGTAHAWVAGWSADYPDPDGVFRGFFQTGWPFYSDDEILEKLEQARSLGNQDERMRLYHEIDRIWVTERAGIVPLAYGRTMLLRRPWVHSVWVNPLQRAHLDKAVVRRS
jgi:ABC-type transport system substrate-binding protein